MNRNFNRWLIVAVLVILACGSLLTLWTVQREDQLQRADLLTKTRQLQAQYDAVLLSTLTGTEEDLESPFYQSLKHRLMEIRSSHSEIRFIYLMGQKPDGTVFIFADSEPAESPDYSPPGQIYSEAGPALRGTFLPERPARQDQRPTAGEPG